VSFFWVDNAPGDGPDAHFHPYSETWIVLTGTAEIEADGEVLTAGPGAIVTATAGTVHRFVSRGADRLEMICIHASPTIEQVFLDEASIASPRGEAR
jgi:mannose-6-phosphate isomerase-like protein (cupin superfamily)